MKRKSCASNLWKLGALVSDPNETKGEGEKHLSIFGNVDSPGFSIGTDIDSSWRGRHVKAEEESYSSFPLSSSSPRLKDAVFSPKLNFAFCRVYGVSTRYCSEHLPF